MNNENLLFTVTKTSWYAKEVCAVWVFRTREAARAYARAKNVKSKRYAYTVGRAKWGPEQ